MTARKTVLITVLHGTIVQLNVWFYAIYSFSMRSSAGNDMTKQREIKAVEKCIYNNKQTERGMSKKLFDQWEEIRVNDFLLIPLILSLF